MCTLLAKLAIGLSATMATGFYYLAAAPPASAIDVCGPGNFSSACVPDRSAAPDSPAASPAASPPDPVPSVPVVESPLATPEPIPSVPVVPSPLTAPEPIPSVVESLPPQIVEPVEPSPLVIPPAPAPEIVEPVVPPPLVIPPAPAPEIVPLPPIQPPAVIPDPIPVPAPPLTLPPTFGNIYANTSVRTTAIPEPGTVVALLLVGAGIIYSGRKRNKQVGQQR